MAINPKLLNDGETSSSTPAPTPRHCSLPMLILLRDPGGLDLPRHEPFADGIVALGVWIVAALLALWLVVQPVVRVAHRDVHDHRTAG